MAAAQLQRQLGGGRRGTNCSPFQLTTHDVIGICVVGKGRWTKVGCAGFVVSDGDDHGVRGAREVWGKWCYSSNRQPGRNIKGINIHLTSLLKNLSGT